MTRGARPKLDAVSLDRALKLKRMGASNKDIAAAIGVHPSTFSTWVNHPKTDNQRKLSKGLKKSEADYKNSVLALILKAAQEGSWQAAAWILERKYPEEYARRDGRPKGGQDGPEAPVFVFERGGGDG